jgi:hypothetical protein
MDKTMFETAGGGQNHESQFSLEPLEPFYGYFMDNIKQQPLRIYIIGRLVTDEGDAEIERKKDLIRIINRNPLSLEYIRSSLGDEKLDGAPGWREKFSQHPINE